jgi:hypothetical protein
MNSILIIYGWEWTSKIESIFVSELTQSPNNSKIHRITKEADVDPYATAHKCISTTSARLGGRVKIYGQGA